jgi:hypothetical protein
MRDGFPGTKPLTPYEVQRIDCQHWKYQCAWGYSTEMGLFWLKYINRSCETHRNLPSGNVPDKRYPSRHTLPRIGGHNYNIG